MNRCTYNSSLRKGLVRRLFAKEKEFKFPTHLSRNLHNSFGSNAIDTSSSFQEAPEARVVRYGDLLSNREDEQATSCAIQLSSKAKWRQLRAKEYVFEQKDEVGVGADGRRQIRSASAEQNFGEAFAGFVKFLFGSQFIELCFGRRMNRVEDRLKNLTLDQCRNEVVVAPIRREQSVESANLGPLDWSGERPKEIYRMEACRE